MRSGLIRNAKGPSVMYDYWMTAATEEVTLRPKTPYIGAEGQFEGMSVNGSTRTCRPSHISNTSRRPSAEVSLPSQRQPMADVPVGVLQMAMHAADEIKGDNRDFRFISRRQGTATSGVQEREQSARATLPISISATT